MTEICYTVKLEMFNMYNPKYIINDQMWQYRSPKGPAIHTFFTADGTAIGMFQGSRGVRPDLDFKVKILLPNPESVPYLLPHDEWVVDLLIKAQHYKRRNYRSS